MQRIDVFMAAHIDRTLPVLYAAIAAQALLTLTVSVPQIPCHEWKTESCACIKSCQQTSGPLTATPSILPWSLQQQAQHSTASPA